MKKFEFYAFLFVCVFATSVAQGAVVLPITDNFPSGLPELEWEDYSGPYSVIEAFSPTAPGGDGYVMNVNDGGGWQMVHLVADDATLGDYRVTAYLYIPNDTDGWARHGIFARAETENWSSPMYFASIDTDDGQMRCGVYTVARSTWEVFKAEPDYPRDRWYKFELSTKGTTITMKIDDVEFFSGEVATHYATGYFGIFTYQNGGGSPTRCDRITVESLEDPTPTPTEIPETPTPSTSVDNWELYE